MSDKHDQLEKEIDERTIVDVLTYMVDSQRNNKLSTKIDKNNNWEHVQKPLLLLTVNQRIILYDDIQYLFGVSTVGQLVNRAKAMLVKYTALWVIANCPKNMTEWINFFKDNSNSVAQQTYSAVLWTDFTGIYGD